MKKEVLLPDKFDKNSKLMGTITDFVKKFSPYELSIGSNLVLYFDKKSCAYYLNCHLDGNMLSSKCDLEATLEGDDEDEIYKLNRDITEDKNAYQLMEFDASKGRSFEDIVIEYDVSYHNTKPLKVYGGQHRIRAITKTLEESGTSLHGIRVYFDLTREQKVEIATVNNTSIAVPNDLLDRMQESLLGSELRDWCQKVGLLETGQDFSDKRSKTIPTVRIARTLLVNYFIGLNAGDNDFHQPMVCTSGGREDKYDEIRKQIKWEDENLLEMGKQFTHLHHVQMERVNNRTHDSNAEFARKALSLSVVASWAYAVGLFTRHKEHLTSLYSLPESVSPPSDPLSAKDLSEARLKGTDPDTYRGLGTRSSASELGRMLEVFLVLTTRATKKIITKQLANAAIQSYEAKRATHEANKVLGKI